MKREIFNQKSMERFSAPEQMNDYLRVTTPTLWVILASVILLLAALFLWSSVTAVESYASGTAEVENGVLTLRFRSADKAELVETGMRINVGELQTPILSLGRDGDGTVFAIASVDLPDGSYDARVGYTSSQIIDLLFN